MHTCGKLLKTSFDDCLLSSRGWEQSCRKRLKVRSRDTKGMASVLHARSDKDILEEVLQRIQHKDSGTPMSQEEQAVVNDCLEELEERGKSQTPRPLDNPEIFGNFNVAYTSTQRAPRQDGQPAGGGFRGSVGRRIFKTTNLCQSVMQPDLVTNKVEFMLFGLWQGFVGLRGCFEAQGSTQDTVKVNFESPRLSFGNSIDLPIGPRSSVVLTTTYLTPETRIGRGSRGSLFVFTKGGPADKAGMNLVGLGKTKVSGWLTIAGFLAILGALTAGLWRSSAIGKGVALVPSLLIAFLMQAIVRALLSRKA